MKKILALIFILSSMFIQTAIADQIHLLNGDRISGQIIDSSLQSVQIKAAGIGLIQIDRSVIEKTLTDSEIAEEEMKKTKKESKKWSGEIAAGFERVTGNTKTTELTGDLKVGYKTKVNEYKTKWASYYSAENRKMNAQKHSGLVRWDHRFFEAKKFFSFLSTEYNRDRFANIRHRFIPGAGAGYWWAEGDRFKLKTEAGIGYEYTEFRDETDSMGEAILIPSLYAEIKLWRDAKVSEELTVYPNLTESGEYRLISETTLDNPLNDRLSMKFQLIDEYNSNPGIDTKKNDVRIVSKLVYKL